MIFNMVGKGGGGSLLISDTLDVNGGIIRTITATKVVKLQTKTITPTSSAQTVNPDTGYDGFSQVTVEASSGGITPTGNIDITSDGVIDVTNYATATVPSASFYPVMSDLGYSTVNNIRQWKIQAFTELDTSEGDIEGWISEGNYGGQTTTYHAVPKNTTVTPTESSQTIGGTNYMMEGAVTVNAIPSNYVGSEIRRLGNNNIHQSGGTVYTDVGYYEQVSGIALSAGTEGTPTATKGTVSNHAVTVTPSVTNSAGYISGGTKTGTAVSVSASELVNGTYTVDSSGTKDVTNYASVSVPNGSITAPSTISGSSATVSTGTNTLTLSKTVSVTPNVTTAGYVSSGTAGNSSISLTASVTTKAAATITPGTTNQTIASGTYLTGTQTISGDADLVASNIVNGVQIFGVTGNVVLQNYYTGSSAPSSSTGSNGDLYLQS